MILIQLLLKRMLVSSWREIMLYSDTCWVVTHMEITRQNSKAAFLQPMPAIVLVQTMKERLRISELGEEQLHGAKSTPRLLADAEKRRF